MSTDRRSLVQRMIDAGRHAGAGPRILGGWTETVGACRHAVKRSEAPCVRGRYLCTAEDLAVTGYQCNEVHCPFDKFMERET